MRDDKSDRKISPIANAGEMLVNFHLLRHQLSYLFPPVK